MGNIEKNKQFGKEISKKKKLKQASNNEIIMACAIERNALVGAFMDDNHIKNNLVRKLKVLKNGTIKIIGL